MKASTLAIEQIDDLSIELTPYLNKVVSRVANRISLSFASPMAPTELNDDEMSVLVTAALSEAVAEFEVLGIERPDLFQQLRSPAVKIEDPIAFAHQLMERASIGYDPLPWGMQDPPDSGLGKFGVGVEVVSVLGYGAYIGLRLGIPVGLAVYNAVGFGLMGLLGALGIATGAVPLAVIVIAAILGIGVGLAALAGTVYLFSQLLGMFYSVAGSVLGTIGDAIASAISKAVDKIMKKAIDKAGHIADGTSSKKDKKKEEDDNKPDGEGIIALPPVIIVGEWLVEHALSARYYSTVVRAVHTMVVAEYSNKWDTQWAQVV